MHGHDRLHKELMAIRSNFPKDKSDWASIVQLTNSNVYPTLFLDLARRCCSTTSSANMISIIMITNFDSMSFSLWQTFVSRQRHIPLSLNDP